MIDFFNLKVFIIKVLQKYIINFITLNLIKEHGNEVNEKNLFY